MVGTLCQSGAVLIKAGTNVSSNFKDALGEPNIVPLINQAEGYLSVITREDLVAGFAGYDSIIKLILEEACSNLAAIYAIQYDMLNYTSRQEAEDMINVLFARLEEIINVLKDKQNGIIYIKGA